MRWLFDILDHFYRNIYQCCLWVACFFFVVALTAVSAQYIGDNLSQKILNAKSIVVSVVYDDDEDNRRILDDLVQKFNSNTDLQGLNVKFEKINANDEKVKNGKYVILMTKDRELLEELSAESKLAILDDNIFTSHVKPYVEFSKYNEYASVETIYGINVYVAYFGKLKSIERAKVIKMFSYFNKVVFKASGFGTEIKID